VAWWSNLVLLVSPGHVCMCALHCVYGYTLFSPFTAGCADGRIELKPSSCRWWLRSRVLCCPEPSIRLYPFSPSCGFFCLATALAPNRHRPIEIRGSLKMVLACLPHRMLPSLSTAASLFNPIFAVAKLLRLLSTTSLPAHCKNPTQHLSQSSRRVLET
jgi:hypothetical protein